MKRVIFCFFIIIISVQILFPQGMDWGDAPDNLITPRYPTLATNNGAHHIILPGMHLGINVDAEFDGQPNPPGNATGDDYTNLDDANGVIFNSWLIPGQTATVIVIASSPTLAAGLLNAWIDFNNDGDWMDTGEQVFTNTVLSKGYNLLTYNVPATIPTKMTTFARFRYSSAGGIPFFGPAPDGEVEDYALYLGSPPSPGGDVCIDPDPSQTLVQNEISLAIVPDSNIVGEPSLMVAAYNDEPYPGGPGLGVSTSTDGGTTWTNTHLPYPFDPISGITLLDAFDPSVAINDSNHIFVAHISTDYNWTTGSISGLFVHKSVDGGQSWLNPVPVAANGPPASPSDSNYRFNDRDQIIADRYPNSPYHNNIYITWIKDRGWQQPSPWSDIYFSYSTNGGATFSPAKRINTWANNMGNMPIPEVAKNGTVYVLWIDYNVQTGGKGILYLDKSTDGGVNWGADMLVDTIDLPPLFLSSNVGLDAKAKGAAVIRSSPFDPNELYIVYAANPGGPDEADIFFIKSTDGGTLWSTPLRVNDDATQLDQMLPWMVVKPNGIIDIAWYDRRNDALDRGWDIYFTTSADGGNSFVANTMVNGYPQSFTPTTRSGRWLGEYLGLAADQHHARIIYATSAFDLLGNVFYVETPNPCPSKRVLNTGKIYPALYQADTIVVAASLDTGGWVIFNANHEIQFLNGFDAPFGSKMLAVIAASSCVFVPPSGIPLGSQPIAETREEIGQIFLEEEENIESFPAEKNVRFYPNPASSLLNYQFDKPFGSQEQVSVRIFDRLGRLVIYQTEPTLGQGQVNVSYLRDGVYYVIVEWKDGIKSDRFVRIGQ